ncbi:sorbitol dehydrogenase 1 [Trichomonascus vanleenenianus]|uniref:NAD(P)-dependent alcohol dehydrogenase n=1 Tax=Trichomonascus vanleenenianus TaxID=2268995 RepID=UPI003ECA593D
MTTQKIQASVLKKQKDLTLETREINAPQGSEVQVAVKATTLCGSDMHYYLHGRNGDNIVREPLTLGHESAGVITAVGPEVEGLKVGDRVALEVGKPCGYCEVCKKGRYNLCSKMQFRSSAKSFPHFQGTLQERINCPASWVYKLPKSVSLEDAALLEPLAVAIHAANRATIEHGSTCLVIGAGAVGLLSAAIARVNGCSTVVICDIAKNRVDFAVENGLADYGYTVPLKRGQTTEEKLQISQELADALTSIETEDGPIGEFNYTFECTGVESCVQAGIYATAPGGKVLFVGMGQPVQTLHMSAALMREVDLLGVLRYANAYPTGIRLMASKQIPALDKMITHRIKGLENVPEAFELAGKPQDKEGNLVIKVAVVLD